MIWLSACFTALAVIPGRSLAEADVPLTKDDFAWSRTINVDTSGVIQVVELPVEIYVESVERGLADLRVFDASGVAVPHAISATVAPKRAEPILTPLPLFHLPEGTAADETVLLGTGYRVDLGIDRERATLKLESTPGITFRHEKPRAYLVDASDLEGAITGFEFELTPQSEDFLVPLRVEATNDFVRYKELTAAAVVAQLAGAGQRIDRRRIRFQQSSRNYLRITWPRGDRAPGIVGVRAVQQAPSPSVKRLTARVEAEQIDSDSYRFDLGGWPPVDRIQVDLGEGRALVSAEVFRSEHEEGPWRRVHAGLIYRLGTSDDRATRNPAIELPRGPTRFIRIDIAPKGGGMDGAAPLLEPSWVSERLYFIQQGEGPHTLVYGKLGAPAARFTTPQLLAATRRLLDDQRPIPSTATLGPR
ncbi:MAG: DUF3999 domain-containing protein, partial [bacterium]|nr:DUF3999 domain-containing protein [bacterium]